MRTIIVDDELWAIKQLQSELQKNENVEIAGVFQDPLDAYEYAKENRVDFALLDVKMHGIDGIELGRRMRELYPDVIIVYISSYPEYFSDAYRNVRADYYMLKPYRKEDIEDVMDRVCFFLKGNKRRFK